MPTPMLPNDERIVPGVACLVRIVAIDKAERDDRGRIEVEFVARALFRIEGVYLDPIVSKVAKTGELKVVGATYELRTGTVDVFV